MVKSSKAIPEWFSAYELAKLGAELVGGLPTTAPGCKGRAESEGWESRTVKGKGGKGGLRTEYKPTGKVMLAIAAYYKDSIVDYYSNPPTRTIEQPIKAYRDVSDIDPVYIEHYLDVRASSGPGQAVPTDQMVLQVAINAKDFRDYIGMSPKNIKIITNYGDSNKPTINHGDQVLVDITCHSFIDDALYVIQQGENLRIKRIKLRLDGSIEVKSDNVKDFSPEFYKPEEAAEFKVIGKVLPFKFGKFDI